MSWQTFHSEGFIMRQKSLCNEWRSPESVRVISVRQPWAWAIVCGPKRVENRMQPTSYRGRLLIHAGRSRRWLDDGLEFLRRLGVAPPDPTSLTFGAIVGTCELVGCVPIATAPPDPFAGGPFCWLLAEVRALPRPVPYAGALGLRRPSGDVLQAVVAQDAAFDARR